MASPLDWPGATCVDSLLTGQPWIGEWVDRSTSRRSEPGADGVEELLVELSPIPCLAHLSAEDYRRVVRDLVREIEEETAARHASAGTRPVGPEAIRRTRPHDRAKEITKSPAPWFHARSREVREAMRTALTYLHVAYREASERLRAGDRRAVFPANTFPPGLPFVREIEILEPG